MFISDAKPIWAKGKVDELNSSLFFKTIIKEESAVKIRIAANNFYKLFINGEFYAYGPSRDAHNYYRIDEYFINNLDQKKKYIIVIEVSGSNCNSFYAINEKPFLKCEIVNINESKVLKKTGTNFKIFNNDTRIRKVTRFSYQRAFSESYKIDKRYIKFLKTINGVFSKEKVFREKEKIYDERIVNYPSLDFVKFNKVEEGTFFLDKNLEIYEDRYQTLGFLKIFPIDEWEINSNKVASQMSFKIDKLDNKILKANKFITFSNKESLTGFIKLKINVKKDCVIYLLFDEINRNYKNKKELIDISFFRNTTHNCVTYELKEGNYILSTFEPYTLKYLRIACLCGEVKVEQTGVIKYENNDTKNFHYKFDNKKINKIIKAAINTFNHNAVDLLTDCPSRERAGWLCDSYFSGQAEALLTGKNLVEKAFLDNYSKCSKENLPDGMIPMCYPADFPSKEFIPNWSLWYILEIYNYYLRTKDETILKNSINNILGIFDYFQSFENELGLLENLKGWIFVEWSKANDEEFIKGINWPTNILYSESLIKAGELLKNDNLICRGKNIKKLVKEMAFNGEFFVDNSIRNEKNEIVRTENTSETCQYYAIFFDIINENNSTFVNKMIYYFGEYRDDKKVFPKVYKSNVLMGIMLRLMILNKYRLTNKVFKESVEYFYKMANLTGTLWEHDNVFASLNHCFTSYIVNIILNANFGLDWIDNQNKIVYLYKKAALHDGVVIVPCNNNESIKFIVSNKRLDFELPNNYRILWE